MKELMRKAHQLTKEIKREYPEVDYKFQLGLCMKYLLNEKKENEKMNGMEVLESKLEEIATGSGYEADDCSVERKLWERGDISRTYINFNVKRKTMTFYFDNETGCLYSYNATTSIMREIYNTMKPLVLEFKADLMFEKTKKN